jgi:hypothetical protein
MKYKGKMWCDGYVDPDGWVTDAIIRGKRISIDWKEDETQGHLEAESSDGIHFEGVYRYTPPPPQEHAFSLKKYTSGTDVLLFGTWRRLEDGEKGTWVFELTPVK